MASNGTALSRSGVITIAGQAYTITQGGAACTYTLSATSTNVGPAAASGTVNVTTAGRLHLDSEQYELVDCSELRSQQHQ